MIPIIEEKENGQYSISGKVPLIDLTTEQAQLREKSIDANLELHYLKELEAQIVQEKLSIKQWEETFPEAKDTIGEVILELIDKAKGHWERVDKLVEYYMVQEPRAKPVCRLMIGFIHSQEILPIEEKIDRLNYQYDILSNYKKEAKQIDIEILKDRADIKSIVEAHGIKLRKMGRNWVGLCPFHAEKTPSFNVMDKRFHCFGCGKSGDIIDFIQQTENISFKEALSKLQ